MLIPSEKLAEAVQSLVRTFTKVAEETQSGQLRHELGPIIAELKRRGAAAAIEYPKLVARLQQQKESLQQEVEQFNRQAQETKAQQEAAAAAATAPRAVPEKAPAVPVKPPELREFPAEMGMELRDELLKWAHSEVPKPVAPPAFTGDGSVATSWTEPNASEPTAPPAQTDRSTLKPRRSTPLSRPKAPDPAFDESLGKMPFEDEE